MPRPLLSQLMYSSDVVELSNVFLSLILFFFWPQEEIIVLCHLAIGRIVRIILDKVVVRSVAGHSWTIAFKLIARFSSPALPPATVTSSIPFGIFVGPQSKWGQHEAKPIYSILTLNGHAARAKNKHFIGCLVLAYWYFWTVYYHSVN